MFTNPITHMKAKLYIVGKHKPSYGHLTSGLISAG